MEVCNLVLKLNYSENKHVSLTGFKNLWSSCYWSGALWLYPLSYSETRSHGVPSHRLSSCKYSITAGHMSHICLLDMSDRPIAI